MVEIKELWLARDESGTYYIYDKEPTYDASSGEYECQEDMVLIDCSPIGLKVKEKIRLEVRFDRKEISE